MSRPRLIVCDCKDGHDPRCYVGIRLVIKERICNARGITFHVPDDVEEEIDRLTEEEHAKRHRLQPKLD